MSSYSPSDDLSKEEIFNYINMKAPLTEIIRRAWLDGFEWGQEVGYENAIDELD